MDLIDWLFWSVGKGFAVALKFVEITVPKISDTGYAVVGFFCMIAIAVLLFTTLGIFHE
jgi:hypothetical protein